MPALPEDAKNKLGNVGIDVTESTQRSKPLRRARRIILGMLEIRALHASDLPAFVALRNEMLLRYPEAFTSDYKTERDRPPESFVSRLGSPASGHAIWGAFEGAAPRQRLLGTVAMERDRDPRPHKRHIAQVTAVMVSPQAQGRGIASKLLACCIQAASEIAELDQLILTVTASNAQVVRLYERAGFVSYGLLPRAICMSGQYLDKLHMRLDLTARRGQLPRQSEP